MVAPPSTALELDLPRGAHRDTLLDALANVVRRRGFEPLVVAPVLLPRSEYFPERWEQSVVGAQRLLRRLMHYAGLGEFRVRLDSWREQAAIRGIAGAFHQEGHAAAWFAGLHEGTFEFAVELEQLRHEESLVATLGHEVAHAYRHHHGLVISDRDLEEKLTDLTSVYLGFGLFALNASHVVETGGMSQTGEKLLYETRSLGYLSPPELALLLAAQLAARNDAAEQRAVCKELLPNHAALLESGLHEFLEDVEGLRRRLAVPERGSWPARNKLGELAPLPDDEEAPDDAGLPDDPAEGEDEPELGTGPIVFRVRQHRAASVGGLFGLASATACGVAGAETVAFWGLSVIGAGVGFAVGHRIRADECSNCRADLKRDDERCTRCGGSIVGEITGRDQRLEAEDRYYAERGQAGDDDDAGDDLEDPMAILLTALFVAWGLSRGLIAEDASDAEIELARRAKELEFDANALFSAWQEPGLFREEAMRFADDYISGPAAHRAEDFRIMTTANELDDRPANYQRMAAILDRRFADWKARTQ